ncbi:hypothetical protein MRX96_038237 [Rhipicephalus microplus]
MDRMRNEPRRRSSRSRLVARSEMCCARRRYNLAQTSPSRSAKRALFSRQRNNVLKRWHEIKNNRTRKTPSSVQQPSDTFRRSCTLACGKAVKSTLLPARYAVPLLRRLALGSERPCFTTTVAGAFSELLTRV